MLTKTFRAPNMLAALKNVQAELGPDAMIISMREVPAGPIWAAWKKPGVEVIASKAAKTESDTKPAQPEEMIQEKLASPSSEDLRREIENLKMLVTGKNSLPKGNTKMDESQVIHQEAKVTKERTTEKQHFDISDFKSLREEIVPDFSKISSKSNELLSKTETVIVEKIEKPEIPPQLIEVKQKLSDQGIKEELINKIIDTNLDALSPSILNDEPRLDRFVSHQLAACLPPSRKTIALLPSRIMALIGTSGSGKTASCAKLASFYMITMGKKVVWIEADTIKTSAISEARTYTETLGIPLFLAYTPQELSELIDSQKDADLILVDTTSCNPRNEDSVVELGSFLSVLPPGCSYLVASATTKEQDLVQTEKTLNQFGIKGVILTKMDETGSFGSCFNMIWQRKLPIYFFSTGIQIFGNLKPGTPESLANAIVAGSFNKE